MMEKVKILVACNKRGEVYHDDVYIPMHVGRAVSKYKDEMVDMLGDDTGDNISEKNAKYCELTAQYWAWKNLHNVEYIGFCHYRRFFKYKITNENVDEIKNKDMMVLRYKFSYSMYWEIIRYIGVEDFTILLMVLKKKYPEYEQTMIKYLCGNVLYPKNMFVCKKKLFDKYAEWLFDILFECEKHMKTSPYTRVKRNLAYMGEYLLTVYIMHNHLKLKYTIEESKKNSIKGEIKRFIWNISCKMNLKSRTPKTLESFYLYPVMIGFEQDNIKI
jgi:hypothetical protein